MDADEELRLETPRLVLRDLVDDDWLLVHALASEPEVRRFQTWLRLDGEAQCRAWLSELLARTNHRRPRSSYNLGIAVKPASDLVGWLGFGDPYDPSKGDVEVGYALLPSHWNQGYMTEAVSAVIDFVFRSAEKHSICATCVDTNPASARVLARAGMSLVDEWDEEDAGITEHHLCYRIERRQWLGDSTRGPNAVL